MLIFSFVSAPKGYYVPPERHKQYYQLPQENQPISQADQQPQQGRKGSSLFPSPFPSNVNVLWVRMKVQ